MEVPNQMFYYGMSDFIPLVELDPPGPFRYPGRNVMFFEKDVTSLIRKKSCPYCGQPISEKKLERPFSKDADSILVEYETHYSALGCSCFLFCCSVCGWWNVLEHCDGTSMKYHDICNLDAAHWGKIKVFDLDDMEAPIEHLRGYLRNHPDKLYKISPVAFEKLTASILKDYFNCNAVHVGGPSDNGIDVILVDADRPILVQVKRRENSESFENVKIVREILGVMLAQGFYNGLIVSTAKRFTDEAVRMVKLPALLQQGYTLNLYNYNDVLAILKCTADREHKPWEELW